nr:hypothetical protein [Bacillota bacterium]
MPNPSPICRRCWRRRWRKKGSTPRRSRCCVRGLRKGSERPVGIAAWEAVAAFVRDHAYAVILVLTVIIYNLGFARKLPLLKTVIVYLLLAIGCIPLTVLYALGLPIVAALLVGVALLTVVQIRRRASERRKREEPTA